MARTWMTAAVLAATLAAGVAPVAASADEWRGGGYGYDHDRSDRDGWRDRERGREWREREWREHQRREYYDRGGTGYGYAPSYYGYVPSYGYAPSYPAYRGTYAPGGYYRESYQPAYRYGDRCRSDGTAGAVIGAIAGGLLGNGLSGRHDRGFGTVIGAGGGAIAGSAIARSGC